MKITIEFEDANIPTHVYHPNKDDVWKILDILEKRQFLSFEEFKNKWININKVVKST